jgi:putative ABC transport system ATP-binding protein
VTQTGSAPMIQLEGIVKRYAMGDGLVAALDGVDLQIERGEFISIMGASGSGKSTLMQILGALDTPTEGAFVLEGYDITRLPDAELARIRNQHFGFVFQAYNLFPELTTLENVELPLVYAGIAAKARREQAKAYLEAVGLEDRMRHYPSQLSGGQQQRVAIARAIVTEPTVLLADEPTGNLSREGGDEVLAIFEQLHAEGVSVVLVTHDPRVGAFAERCVKLEDGRVVSDDWVTERTVLELASAF